MSAAPAPSGPQPASPLEQSGGSRRRASRRKPAAAPGLLVHGSSRRGGTGHRPGWDLRAAPECDRARRVRGPADRARRERAPASGAPSRGRPGGGSPGGRASASPPELGESRSQAERGPGDRKLRTPQALPWPRAETGDLLRLVHRSEGFSLYAVVDPGGRSVPSVTYPTRCHSPFASSRDPPPYAISA